MGLPTLLGLVQIVSLHSATSATPKNAFACTTRRTSDPNQAYTILTSLRVGLIAAQAYEAGATADFDYFTIEPLP
jgi:hypothetical protein